MHARPPPPALAAKPPPPPARTLRPSYPLLPPSWQLLWWPQRSLKPLYNACTEGTERGHKRVSDRWEPSRRGPATPPGGSGGSPAAYASAPTCEPPPAPFEAHNRLCCCCCCCSAAASEGRLRRRDGRLRCRHRVFWRSDRRRRLRTHCCHRLRCSCRPGSRPDGRSGRSMRRTRPAQRAHGEGRNEAQTAQGRVRRAKWKPEGGQGLGDGGGCGRYRGSGVEARSSSSRSRLRGRRGPG